ncbi:helicase, partial [Bacillus sp. S34]|nr:helicase [Bacillus sp. S34]
MPVGNDGDERAYFTDHYRSMWFLDAKVWLEAELHIVELATVHRQRDDAFAAML